MARAAGWLGVLRRIVLWFVVLAVLVGALVGYVVWRELMAELPPVDKLLHYQPPAATRVFAEDGTLIGEFYVERRYPVPLDRIPMKVRNAFLAAEDADFYTHKGVDPVSILRAVVRNVLAQGTVQGGSTITQQVVKNLLLTPERSYERKLKEAILALRLEERLSKDEILYLYLNHIYFGAGAHGIAAAARTFFDVEVEQLTLGQAAMLAGLPQRPSEYDPLRHPLRAQSRQHYVLERMLKEKLISKVEYDEAMKPIQLSPHRSTSYIAAPWYVEHVRRLLEERYGASVPAQLGLRVHTAVDLRLQRAAEAALQKGLKELDRRQGFRGPLRHLEPKKVEGFLTREAMTKQPEGTMRAVVTSVRSTELLVRTGWEKGVLPADALVHGSRRLATSTFRAGDVIAVTRTGTGPDGSARFALDQEPQVEGALVVFDLYTGHVKALVGGYAFQRSQFNRAVQAKRQPGSAFKPLLYASALDRGYTPASVVLDAPLSLPGGPRGTAWTPKNYGGKYYGPTPLRSALARSLNTVTVRLVEDVGLDTVRKDLGRFGLSSPIPRNLSIALGSAEVTPMELVRAYGVFATGGKLFEPIVITGVADQAGNPIAFSGTRPTFKKVMEPSTAYLVTNMMESVVKNGTGRKALEVGRPVAGKTGTTNDTHDAWFVGYTPDVLAGVWVGFDAERSLGSHETGGHAAAPIWTEFMKIAMQDRPVLDFPVPKGIAHTQIDPASGKRAVPGGPSKMEVFAEGTEPTEYADEADEEDDPSRVVVPEYPSDEFED